MSRPKFRSSPLAPPARNSTSFSGLSAARRVRGLEVAVRNTTAGAVSATDVTIDDAAGDFTATHVEGALAELQSDAEADAAALSAHLNDTTDAHDASAISYAGGTGMSATDVEAAIDELATEKANATDLTAHLNDTSDAHDASAISYAGGTGMSATDVEAAIDELATDIAGGTAGYLREIVSFAASGTFTKATYPWLKSVRVRVQAPGGGSGGTTGAGSGQSESGGGGAGGYCEDVIPVASLAANETVTVGGVGTAGISGGGTGGTGGTTSFGAHAIAAGGTGGAGMTSTTGTAAANGGTGGTPSAGDFQCRGGDGGHGRVIGGVPVRISTGGTSFMAGGPQAATGSPGNGTAGYNYGTGASGRVSTTTNAAGSAGGAGIVIVELYG